jgi:hypothetical protein
MLRRRCGRHKRFGWMVLGMVLLCTADVALCAEPASRVSTLHLAGQGIGRLILRDSMGQRKIFSRPEPNLVLPEGDYCLDQVELQGGPSCVPAEQRVLRLRAGVPATLKVGAPLWQGVQIERRGAALVLNYQLVGQGGESYVNRYPNAAPPTFTAYQGQRKITSGQFEYG